MAVQHVEHLHITEADLVLLSFVAHQLELIICFIHVYRIKVIGLLLKLRKVIEELVIAYLQLFNAICTVTTMHRVQIAAGADRYLLLILASHGT